MWRSPKVQQQWKQIKKRTWLQKRYKHGQKVQENMLNIINHLGNENQNPNDLAHCFHWDDYCQKPKTYEWEMEFLCVADRVREAASENSTAQHIQSF